MNKNWWYEHSSNGTLITLIVNYALNCRMIWRKSPLVEIKIIYRNFLFTKVIKSSLIHNHHHRHSHKQHTFMHRTYLDKAHESITSIVRKVKYFFLFDRNAIGWQTRCAHSDDLVPRLECAWHFVFLFMSEIETTACFPLGLGMRTWNIIYVSYIFIFSSPSTSKA